MDTQNITLDSVIPKHALEVEWLNNEEYKNYCPAKGEIVVYDIEVDKNGSILTIEEGGLLVARLPHGRNFPYTVERQKIGDGIHNVNELPFSFVTRKEILDNTNTSFPFEKRLVCNKNTTGANASATLVTKQQNNDSSFIRYDVIFEYKYEKIGSGIELALIKKYPENGQYLVQLNLAESEAGTSGKVNYNFSEKNNPNDWSSIDALEGLQLHSNDSDDNKYSGFKVSIIWESTEPEATISILINNVEVWKRAANYIDITNHPIVGLIGMTNGYQGKCIVYTSSISFDRNSNNYINYDKLPDGKLNLWNSNSVLGQLKNREPYWQVEYTGTQSYSVPRMDIVDQLASETKQYDYKALKDFKYNWQRVYVENSKERGVYGKIVLTPTGREVDRPFDYDKEDQPSNTNVGFILDSIPIRFGDGIARKNKQTHSMLAGHICVPEDIYVDPKESNDYTEQVDAFYPQIAVSKKYVDGRINTRALKVNNTNNYKQAYVINEMNNAESMAIEKFWNDFGQTVYDFEDKYENTNAISTTIINTLKFESGIQIIPEKATVKFAQQQASVVKRDNGDHYIRIRSTGRKTSQDRSHYVDVQMESRPIDNKTSNVIIMEFDMMSNGNSDNEAYINVCGQFVPFGRISGELNISNKNEWVKVRLEIYKTGFTQIYINNYYIGTKMPGYSTTLWGSNYSNIIYATNEYGEVNLNLDNISFYRTYKNYVANPQGVELVVRDKNNQTIRCNTPENPADDMAVNVAYIEKKLSEIMERLKVIEARLGIT